MTVTRINGSTQIQDATILNAAIAAGAAIATSKLADGANFIQRGGSVAFTADQSMGGFKLTNIGTPTAAGDAATKGYVDTAVTGLLDFKGDTDASTQPNYPAALKGDAYYVSVAGKIGGAAGKTVEVGDVYVAAADNAGGTEAAVGASWFVLEGNISGLSANGLSLITAASYAAMRALLDLEAGTDFYSIAAADAAFQPLDATLAALAAANWAANALPIGSGADTVAQVAFAANTFPARASAGNLVAKAITDFGLSLVDDADAAAGRTTLGGTTVGQAAFTLANPSAITFLRVNADNSVTALNAADFRTAIGASGGTLINRETPAGVINGSNTVFTTANTVVAGTENVFLNGILQDSGAGNDYVFSAGNTITFNSAPVSGDKIRVSYIM